MKAASPAARHRGLGHRARLGWRVPALLMGYLAIVVGLVFLHRVHEEERRDALASVERDEAAVRREVHDAIRATLEAHLVGLDAKVDRALTDPFAPADDLLLVDRTSGGKLIAVLPPRATAAGPSLTLAVLRSLDEQSPQAAAARAALSDAAAARAALSDAAAARAALSDAADARAALTDEVAAERLGLAAALAREDTPESKARAMNAWLDHRARFSLRAEVDLPLTVHTVEALDAVHALEPELARALLRDGVPRPDGVVPGLLASLLRARDKLPLADLRALAARVVPVAKRWLVRVDDFEARMETLAAPPLDPVALIASAATPFGVERGQPDDARPPAGALRIAYDPHATASAWVLAPEGPGTRVLGTRVDLSALVGLHRARLVAAGRLDPDAQIATSPLGELTTMAFEVKHQEIERRAVLKAMPLLAVLALGLAVVVLAVVLQRRRASFIALRTQLLSAVTHELKTPLASIRALAETLEDKLADEPAAKDYPHRIVQSSERLGFLIDNVLSFTRLEGGAWTPHLIEVPLTELEGLIGDFFAADLVPRARPVDLAVVIPPELGDRAIAIDRDLVFLMLSNLVDNAARYATRERVKVMITARAAGRGLALEVSDDGPGLDAEGTGRQAAPADPKTRPRSTGLGLAICRAVMALHHGRFGVLRSDPQGTTFEALFPGLRPRGVASGTLDERRSPPDGDPR